MLIIIWLQHIILISIFGLIGTRCTKMSLILNFGKMLNQFPCVTWPEHAVKIECTMHCTSFLLGLLTHLLNSHMHIFPYFENGLPISSHMVILGFQAEDCVYLNIEILDFISESLNKIKLDIRNRKNEYFHLQRGTALKVKRCQSTGAIHPWYVLKNSNVEYWKQTNWLFHTYGWTFLKQSPL